MASFSGIRMHAEGGKRFTYQGKSAMKVSVAFAFALLLTACNSKLTEAECAVMANREIQYIVQDLPAEEAEATKAFFAPSLRQGIDKCLAGETYKRKNYDCIVESNNNAETAECFAGAKTFINIQKGR